MPNYWIFQSNPDLYDIDTALEQLETIRWKVPQYAGELRAGDKVAIWRSGSEAGVIGGGTLLEPPRELPARTEERKMYQNFDSDSPEMKTTRAPIRVRPVEFVSKRQVKYDSQLGDHQIVVAPMGTVFPVSGDQWDALIALSPELGELWDVESTDPSHWPTPFSWEHRHKSVYPLPGGYDSYLTTLAELLEHVDEIRPETDKFDEWIQNTFQISATSSRQALRFIDRISLLSSRGGTAELTPEAHYWLTNRENDYLVALLHSRVQLIGELLELLDGPHPPDELQKIE